MGCILQGLVTREGICVLLQACETHWKGVSKGLTQSNETLREMAVGTVKAMECWGETKGQWEIQGNQQGPVGDINPKDGI